MRALVITQSITTREQRSVEQYLQNLSKYDVLTPEEEVALFQKYQSGCDVSYEKIISHNLRFVVSVAKKYQNMGLSLSDLINEGNIGLMKAAQRFDISKGFKFISYAVWWIRQSILQALNDKGRKIRLPLNVTGNIYKVRAKMLDIHQREERDASIEELAEATGLTEENVKKCIENYGRCKSLDMPLGEESTATLGDMLEDDTLDSPDHQLSIVETQKTDVQRLLSRLPEREATVVSMFFGIGTGHASSLSDIADEVGISRERVRQIKDKAIDKLRSKVGDISELATFSEN